MSLQTTTPRHQVTKTALILPEDLTPAEHQSIGVMLLQNQRSWQWHVGDWLAFGERLHGRTYEQMQQLLGLELQTLTNYAYVARSVEISRRREKLSWSLHAEVAPLSAADQERWLCDAELGQMTVSEIRVGIKQERERANPKPVAPTGPTLGSRLEVGPRNEPMLDIERRGIERERQNPAPASQPERPASRVEVSQAANQVRAAVQEAGENAVANERQLTELRNITPGQPLTLTLPPQPADALRALVDGWNEKNPNNTHDTVTFVTALIERETYRARER